MLKKILITLAVISALFVVLVALLLYWARNPFGLEPERLGPKGNENLPEITPAANARNYILFAKHTENNFAIHLPIPSEYFRQEKASHNLIKTYSASVVMYYPKMHSAFHQENAHLRKCNGYCEGYISVFIDANANTARVQDGRILAWALRNDLNDGLHQRYEPLVNEFGFDEHFQIRFPNREETSNGAKNSTQEYLLKRDKDGQIKYLFQCSPYAPSPGCSVKFNLSSRPEVLVDIRFGRHLMSHWESIVNSVDTKITGWGPVRVETLKSR